MNNTEWQEEVVSVFPPPLPPSTAGSSCPSGLPSAATIAREAVYAGGLSSRDIQQRLVPSMRFTCRGNVTRWTAIAKTVGGGSRFPQLSVWRAEGGDSYARVGYSSITETSSPREHVYEHSPDEPLQFESGDILGVYTPPVPRLTLKYQSGGGPQNYLLAGMATQSKRFSLGGKLTSHEYPLVAVEVSPPGCTQGFIDRDTLLSKAAILSGNGSDLAYREATQRIFPSLTLPCSGVILQVTMAALYRGVGGLNRFPEVQIWRWVSDDRWRKVAGVREQAGLSPTGELNVYSYSLEELQPPMAFQSGDVLGLYQPYSSSSTLKVYLQRDSGGPAYYKTAQASPSTELDTDAVGVYSNSHLPLVTMVISTSLVREGGEGE